MARNAKNTRMCAGCRERFDKSELARVCCINGVVSLPKNNCHSEGRGLYLCLSEKCLNMAIKRKSFSRSLKGEIDSGLYDEIKDYIKQTATPSDKN